MRRLVLVVIALVLVSGSAAEAQKRCKKGIPCGNTCISADKVCRTGQSSSGGASDPSPSTSASAVDPAQAKWVASSRGTKYYLATCAAGKRLSPANLVSFKTEEEARKVGYSRSTQKGC